MTIGSHNYHLVITVGVGSYDVCTTLVSQGAQLISSLYLPYKNLVSQRGIQLKRDAFG